MTRILAASLALCLSTACTGGVPGTTLLGDLTHDDWVQVCDDAPTVTEATVDCDGMEVTTTVQTPEECAADNENAWTGCTATVDQMYDAMDAMVLDPCDFASMMTLLGTCPAPAR